MFMKKKYIYIVLLFGFLFSINSSYAQVNVSSHQFKNSQNIKNLTIYPNPVSNGEIYISTKLNLIKEITIYDVLGKKIISKTIVGKVLNISKLTPGVYILKIKENEIPATRKLVVK